MKTNELSPETLKIDMDERVDYRDFCQCLDDFKDWQCQPRKITYGLCTVCGRVAKSKESLKTVEYCSCRGLDEVPYHIGGECIRCHKRVI